MPKKKDEKMALMITRLPEHLHREAKAIAARSGRSLQEVAQELWETWIREEGKKEVDPK